MMPEQEQHHPQEFVASSNEPKDFDNGIAPICLVFPEELERIRAERQYKRYQIVAAFAFESLAIPFAAIITRSSIAISEVAFETVANEPNTYELLNSVTALQLSTLVGVTASVGVGIHLFNRNMQHYREQKNLEESRIEG